MKKGFYSFPLIAILISLFLINSGCNKSDDTTVTPPTDDNFDKEVVSAKNFATFTNIITSANSYQWLFLNNIASSFCPNYYYDSVGVGAFTVNYPPFPGCVDKDSVKRSGTFNLAISVISSDSVYSTVSFNDYRVYKYAENNDTNMVKVTGFLRFSSKKTSASTYNFHAGGEVGFLTLERDSKTITINTLDGTVNYNSASTASDDVYSIFGSANIVDGEFSAAYDLSVSQSSPFQILGNCRYPVSGVLKMLKNGVTSECDFSPNGNACDDAIKFTRGSASKSLNLKGIDF
ncbi:MAG: hypothetical protein JSS63_09400 [Bacteroidetes bacterium]|nr:hypothetical protein [Bacteroidota bacterium]